MNRLRNITFAPVTPVATTSNTVVPATDTTTVTTTEEESHEGCACKKKKAKAKAMKVIGAIVVVSVFIVGIVFGSYLTRKAVNPS